MRLAYQGQVRIPGCRIGRLDRTTRLSTYGEYERCGDNSSFSRLFLQSSQSINPKSSSITPTVVVYFCIFSPFFCSTISLIRPVHVFLDPFRQYTFSKPVSIELFIKAGLKSLDLAMKLTLQLKLSDIVVAARGKKVNLKIEKNRITVKTDKINDRYLIYSGIKDTHFTSLGRLPVTCGYSNIQHALYLIISCIWIV